MASRYDLSDRRQISITYYQENAYIHLRDKFKQKSVSMTKPEFITLLHKSKKILKEMNKLLTDHEDNPTESKSSKKRSVYDEDAAERKSFKKKKHIDVSSDSDDSDYQ